MRVRLVSQWRFPKAAGNAFILLALVAMTGCGKVPTWNELTGGQQQQAQPVTVVAPPQPPVQPVAPQEPPKPNAAAIVAGFKALKSHEITDASLAQLGTLTEGLEAITEINVNGNPFVTSEGLSSIAKLPALKELDLTSTKVEDSGMQKLAGMQSLESLSLCATKVSDAGVAALNTCPNLKKLNLQGCTLTPDGFAAIGKMPALEEIILDLTPGLNNLTLDLICNAKTLRRLHMRDCGGIDDAGLTSLAKLEVLEELNINRARVTGEGFLAVTKGGGLKSIKYLGISVNPINEKGARAINSMKSLEHIDLQQVAMNDLGFSTIVQGMKELKYININEVPGIVGPQAFTALKNCDNLEELHAMKTNIDDRSLAQLKTHTKLKFLDISETKCSINGVAALKKILPDCKIRFANRDH